MPSPNHHGKCTPRVLVIRQGALGDLMHMTASIRSLKLAYPEALVDVVAQAMYQPLLATVPGIHQVYPWPSKGKSPQGGFWHQLWQLHQTLRPNGYTHLINLHPSLKTHALCLALKGFNQTVIYRIYRKQKERFDGEHTGAGSRDTARHHAIEDFWQPFLAAFSREGSSGGLGLPGREHAAHPLHQASQLFQPLQREAALSKVSNPSENLLMTPQEQADWVAWTQEHPDLVEALQGPASVALIPGVGGKRANRQWPVDHYVELAVCLLNTTDVPLVLVGGSDELSMCSELMGLIAQESPNQAHRVHNLCGKTPLTVLKRILSDCRQVIGGDTGPLHLAAALGTPTLGIFGPTSPNRTGPIHAELTRANIQLTDRGIQKPLTWTITPPAHLACWPCEKPECPLTGDDYRQCMQLIYAPQVAQAVTSMLRERRLP